MSKLLTRTEFRESGFKRDKHLCVVCGLKATSVHHILNRNLFTSEHEFGGYLIDNGVSLCNDCHIKAEQTLISCKELRQLAGIKEPVLPEHLEPDQDYDTFGNPILPNGNRLRGEMFFQDSVQKALESVLHLFQPYVKMPRIFHLPWSPGATSDDKIAKDIKALENKEVVVTAKQDGENGNAYSDGYYHARSLSYEAHPSRSYAKSVLVEAAKELPKDWRITVENCYAKHSIHYKNLEALLFVIGIWNERNCILSWDETEEWCQLLGLKTVPVLYRGIWNEELVKKLYQPTYNGDPMEGYVVRVADSFSYAEHKKYCLKFVKANFVTCSEHWKNETIIRNELKQPQ